MLPKEISTVITSTLEHPPATMDKERVNSFTAAHLLFTFWLPRYQSLGLETLGFLVTRRFGCSLPVQADVRGLHPPYLGALERTYLARHLTVREPMRALSGGAGPFPNHVLGSDGTVGPPQRLREPFLTIDSKW